MKNKFAHLGRVLTREEAKLIVGGLYDGGGTGTPGGNNGNPCANCSRIMHRDDDGTYGDGMCSPNTGGSTCHNYCADGFYGNGYYGWC
ncbi:MAG: hypothetical protein JSR12_05800 [Bacteroidetes bacterium]|nr:hypothetical protein [Bacteroidota bacterium]